jgi:hypothetical protein
MKLGEVGQRAGARRRAGTGVKVPNCLLCGAPNPIGHVWVADDANNVVGVVCSGHTLRALVLDPQERIEVRLRIWSDK